jgi:4-amino-4-deoxy-L-arabinose transferase-like glycosyltransferase
MSATVAARPVGANVVRQRLRKLFWLALALRVALALTLHFLVSEELFAPDQRAYHAVGRFLANQWTSDLPLALEGRLSSGPQGYYYVVGVLYFVFGPYSIVPKLLNAFLGALTVPIVYDLAIRMGTTVPAALRASTYTVWFPSLVLWSALNIRDVWIIVLILLICREALILQAKPNPMSLLILGGAVLALVQFRAYLLFAVVGPVVLSFIVQRSRHVGRNLIIGSIAAIAMIYADQTAGEERRARFLDLEEISDIRHWSTVGAGSQFEQVDISTPGKALAYLPKGTALFLLAPFPWMLGSLRQVLALPETLFYYWLIPWILLGIRHLIRHHLRHSLIALLIVAGLTLGYSLGEGNAGTAYRHRAQLLSFFLVFAGVGLEVRREKKLARSYAGFTRTA